MVAVAPLHSLRPDDIRFAGRIIRKSELAPEQVEELRKILQSRGLDLREAPGWYTVATRCAQCGRAACFLHEEEVFRPLLGDDDQWTAIINDIGGVQFFVDHEGAHYSVDEVADIYVMAPAGLLKLISDKQWQCAADERPEGEW